MDVSALGWQGLAVSSESRGEEGSLGDGAMDTLGRMAAASVVGWSWTAAGGTDGGGMAAATAVSVKSLVADRGGRSAVAVASDEGGRLVLGGDDVVGVVAVVTRNVEVGVAVS